MPLYACERCGFTSAAFRTEAASAHHVEYPDCEGVMRIIFRSDERYRTPARTPDLTGPQTAAEGSPPSQGPQNEPDRTFTISEHLEVGGTLHLTLLGDLDVAGAETLSARIAELKTEGGAVRLDLSRLNFIDSSGLQAVLVAVTDARWTGWRLEVAPKVSTSVERAAQIVGIAQVLWPQDPSPPRPTLRPAGNA